MYDKNKTQKIAGAKEQWEQGMVAKTLAKNKERKEEFTTTSGTTIERLYTPADLADFE